MIVNYQTSINYGKNRFERQYKLQLKCCDKFKINNDENFIGLNATKKLFKTRI